MSSERNGPGLRPLHRHALPDARRATTDEVSRQVALVGESPVVAALLAAVDAMLLVLNRERQVVAWNGRVDDPDPGPLGLRPGELLGCVNARGPVGCGSSRACETCGALGAILACERGAGPVGSGCVIPTPAGGALELDVRATPVQIAGDRFTVVTLRDVSAERRREALEQLFFHDVLNTAAGLRAWSWHLRRPGAELEKVGERIEELSRQLEREIRDHRAFLLAEEGTLVADVSTVAAHELVGEVATVFSHHAVGQDRHVDVPRHHPGPSLESDRALLARVLVNMVRNALEATPPGGTVRIGCAADPADGAVTFTVHNATAMPAEVQARVFERSFSTKGRGRGLGTYGMKLIGERTLRGEVSFTSSPEHGTTFSIRVPARLDPFATPA